MPLTFTLGDHDPLTVRRIGFGAMRLTGSAAYDDRRAIPSDRARSIAVLRAAVELGVNEVRADHLAEAATIAPVVAVENRFNLEVRLHEDVLRACIEQGIAFVPYYAIAGEGREAGYPARESVRSLDETVAQIAQRHGATPAQVRLAWTLHQGPNVLAIPGTSSLTHLKENVAAESLELSDEDLALLDG